MLLQALAQTIPSLVLVTWLGTAALASRCGLAVQAAAIAAVLAAVSLAGMWVVLPFWTPWVLWLLYAAALAMALRRGAGRPTWPWALTAGRTNEWASIAVLLLVGGGAAALSLLDKSSI